MTSVDGAELDVSVEGDGPERVVLHGLMSSRASEAEVGLAVTVPGRVIAYDARGHGRSTGRAVAEDYLWTQLADDLRAVLDEHAHGPVDGIGASMGSATLVLAAVAEPARFRRLVLTIPPTAWASRAAQADGYRAMADVVAAAGPEALAAMAGDVPMPPALGDREFPLPDVDPELLPAALRGAALSDLPDPEALRGLDLPVLLVPWTSDPGHPMSTSERLLEVLPHARLHVVATPEDLANRDGVIREFLEEG